jgi:hypothetical protein
MFDFSQGFRDNPQRYSPESVSYPAEKRRKDIEGE